MSTTDFRFAWEGAEGPDAPWGHLQVVELRGTEQMSGLYRYELTLASKVPSPEVDIHDLVQSRATLRIATNSEPAYKVVHGIIAEAEEINTLPDGMLYRVVVVPPLARAQYRKRCRIYLEKTTRQIIDDVLQGDPSLSLAEGATVEDDDGIGASYTPAGEQYTWRVADSLRLDDKTVRPYCVQYNESDFAFVARLLEEEGIAFHFENGRNACLLVLSDKDAGRARLEPFLPLGLAINGREVSTVKLGGRLRAKSVALDDYNWKKPAADMLAEGEGGAGKADLFEYQYPGGFPDAPSQGVPLATAILERYGVEAAYAVGEGKCRFLAAGSIFFLQHAKNRYEGEYLVTRLEVRGHQEGVIPNPNNIVSVPFEMTMECARRGKDGALEESHFRPARVTPRPRILGSQTAFVTAEPSAAGAEIHVGGPAQSEIGCVRLRFHWDRDESRNAKEPSSCWVRVSQMFAGGGEGAVWHPRVGVEVIVEHVEGDPDRPLVTGRVYNGANRPPAPSVGSPTISTFKSFSSPGGGKYNEFMFDDAAGKEEIKLHAARDWNSECARNRTESVGNDSSSSVSVNRTESTGANRSTTVGANNSQVVGANESLAVGANQSLSVGVNQTTLVGASQSITIGADQTVTTGAAQTTTIGAAQAITVGAAQAITVAADQATNVGASQSMTAGGAQSLSSGTSQSMSAPTQSFTSGSLQEFSCTDHTVACGATFQVSAGGSASVTAPTVTVNGDGSVTITGGTITIQGGTIGIEGGSVAVKAGATLDAIGATVNVTGGGLVNVSAGLVKLN